MFRSKRKSTHEPSPPSCPYNAAHALSDQAFKRPATELAEIHNISAATARKWKGRDDALDRSHRAHDLGCTLSAAQEAIVLEMRRLCLLPLDDLLSITQRFINPTASRSSVSRLLRREGMAKLSQL